MKSSGWFENTESLFITMEYFPLGDLQRYMTQLFRESEAQQITFQLLEGLDFMHGNGFTHRDLKPQVCLDLISCFWITLTLRECLRAVYRPGLVGEDW